MDALFKLAGQKLGKDPEELKASLQQGNVSQAIGSLDPKTQAQISSLLQNPKALEAMLGNEQVKSMLANLTKK